MGESREELLLFRALLRCQSISLVCRYFLLPRSTYNKIQGIHEKANPPRGGGAKPRVLRKEDSRVAERRFISISSSHPSLSQRNVPLRCAANTRSASRDNQ